MEQIFVYVALIVFGAALGSFAGAQVWRLRARQLVEDKAAGEKVDSKEYKRLLPLTKARGRRDRSIDLDTGKQLPWYDMIPVVSWFVLRGKSRYSGKPIGHMEILLELGLASFFIASYIWWPFTLDAPLAVAQLGIWLVAGVGLAILFAYDAKWFLLPDKVNFTVIGFGALYALITVLSAANMLAVTISILGSVLIMSGLYLVLYIISKGKWIGFGDIKLGLGLGLLLADWQLAFVALFLANLIGTLIVLPGLVTRKIQRNTHVPFGPLLIVGTVIAQLGGFAIITAYLSIF